MTSSFNTILNLNSDKSRSGINLKRLYFPSCTPITRSKGIKGRSLGSPFRVNQARGSFKKVNWVSFFSPQKFYFKLPMFFFTSIWLRYQKTTLSVFKSALGLLTIIPGSAVPSAFGFFLSPAVGYSVNSKSDTVFSLLLFIKTGTRICFLSDIFKFHFFFSKSPGSFSRVLGFDRWSGFLTVKLPSGSVRLFFFLSRCFSLLPEQCFNSTSYQTGSRGFWKKAGTYNTIGVKPRVRGVAKNPVDHPHGGRAKSIRFQQTPWGKPAKKK